jgi:hypothetical protein
MVHESFVAKSAVKRLDGIGERAGIQATQPLELFGGE